MDIIFYSSRQPFFEFSNFYRVKLFIDGKTWASTEHYYQAMKFKDPMLQEWVRSSHDPKTAAMRGRDKNQPLREDWEEIKEEVMYKALYAKFTQYEKLRKLLLVTKDKKIIEHTTNDSYWGDGGDGSGLNRLGHLLERLRNELRNEELNECIE